MQTASVADPAPFTPTLVKPDVHHPAFRSTSNTMLYVRGGVVVQFGELVVEFDDDTPVRLPETLTPGGDYEVVLNPDSTLSAHAYGAAADFGRPVLGGFHYAPAGNAMTRSGGDAHPAINPYSIYDLNFRPASLNPRGMTLVDDSFWVDIYLLGTNHRTNGTSRYGTRIADGRSLDRLNYADAVAIMAEHGKQLLGVTEFFAAAYGVTEKSARDGEPDTTEIGPADLPFTSKYGLFQATGCMWQWGHNEDPDEPRASLFGGSWLYGSLAGSRCASLARWPENSDDHVGARGRSDHLIHGN